MLMKRKTLSKEEALQKLRHYCRYQARCQSQVTRKLFELGVNKTEHRELIIQLIEDLYLNDEKYAISYATGKFRIKNWGRRKIRYELREKKLNDELIQKAMEQIDEEEYLVTLNKLIFERYNDLKHEQFLVRKKKTMDFLTQKGFEFDLVVKSVQILKEDQ
jgi:regulatory protein